MCVATQSFGVVCLRRGEGTGLLGAFAVTTQGNAVESLRRGEGWIWMEKEGWIAMDGDGETGSQGVRESTGKALSVNGLRVGACCFWKQATTINVLSRSGLGAEFAELVVGLVPHEVWG